MKSSKKLSLILFVMFVVINLQFNTPLTSGMQEEFSLTQLADNIFVPSAFATGGTYEGYLIWCPTMGDYTCSYIWGAVGCDCDAGWPTTCVGAFACFL